MMLQGKRKEVAVTRLKKMMVSKTLLSGRNVLQINLINLKLTEEQVVVLGSGNYIAETVNSIINPNNKKDHEKQKH